MPAKKRSGKNYYKGDRVMRGNWSKKRFARAQSSDRKRKGSKYESWEKKDSFFGLF